MRERILAGGTSRLGIGTLRLDRNISPATLRELVLYGLENGVTYIDCAPTYCDGQCESLVGEAVRPFRDKVRLASKIPLDVLKKQGDLERFLTETLRRMGTERLDYYYLWAVKKAPFETVALGRGFLRELQSLKEQGLVGRIGFSFHDEPAFAADIVDAAIYADAPFDAMLCQYNLLHPEMAWSMEYGKAAGLEILIMGAAAGGKLDPEAAYPFVLGNKNVDTVLTGVTNLSMLRDNLRLERRLRLSAGSFAGTEVSERKKKEALLQLYCTGCRYCLPCPGQIDIPSLLGLWQRYLLSGDKDALQREYRDFTRVNGAPRKSCIHCGRCEEHCPQKLPIRKWIARNVDDY